MTDIVQFPAAQGLKFDETEHAYFLRGRRVPGVTETISRLAPHRMVDEWYLQRGAAVHAAVALALADNLDWESVDARIVGRVRAVMRFLDECKVTPCFFERRLASTKYQFAGTVDFFGDYRDEFRVLADWKGSLCPRVELQMGAYALLLTENGEKCTRAVAVETHDDGSFRCRWFTGPQLRIASQTFLAFLTAANWCAAHKIPTETNP